MRNFVAASAALAIVLAIGSAGTSQAQTVDGPKIEWKHSLWGKRRANTEGIEKVNEILKARTNGNFSIKIGYGEVFSAPSTAPTSVISIIPARHPPGWCSRCRSCRSRT
jgi:TRAP-type C4-dicarboxylate transport system substrate-binding protein